MLLLHHAPSILPAAERESRCSQYVGEPATGRLGFFVAIRVIVSKSTNSSYFNMLTPHYLQVPFSEVKT